MVESQAQRAEELVSREHRQAIQGYQNQPNRGPDTPWLVVESDGSMVRTGELAIDPEGGVSPKRRQPKRRQQTQWREVRLSVVQVPGAEERQYGAVLGPPQRVGQQMLALATGAGYGENTQVHGVGDGAPWIAQQIAEVFPRHQYLLDRYSASGGLEHLYAGATGLPQAGGEEAGVWVAQQMALIDQGKAAEVIANCAGAGGENSQHPLSQLARYLENQQGRLDYAGAREQGLPWAVVQ